MWYALWFFQKYSKLDKIKITYQYIEHTNSDNSILLERKYLNDYKKSLLDNINKIETDEDTFFVDKQLGSKTFGEILDKYPGEDGVKILTTPKLYAALLTAVYYYKD